MRIYLFLNIRLKIAYMALEREQSVFEVFVSSLLKTYMELRHPSNDLKVKALINQISREFKVDMAQLEMDVLRKIGFFMTKHEAKAP
jgi:hypothetical protein